MRSHPLYEDDKLVCELKQGNSEAFKQLFKSHFSELYHFANSIINNESLAKDIVQDLFIKIWDKRQGLDEGQSLNNYLYVSVRNSCYTYLKRQIPHVDIDALQNSCIPVDFPDEFDKTENHVLWDAVEALPLQCKIVFKLIVIEEYSYKEVAVKLNISVNTVKTQILRASRTLRGKLTPYQAKILFFVIFNRSL